MVGSRRAPLAKQKWTEEEEAALRAGVEKYEAGKWRHIQKDEILGPILKNRSNVDLKDKWRNLNMDGNSSRRESGSQGRSRSKRRSRNIEDLEDDKEFVVRNSLNVDRPSRRQRTGRQRRPSCWLENESEAESSVLDREDPQEEESEKKVDVKDEIQISPTVVLSILLRNQDLGPCDEDTLCQWIQEFFSVTHVPVAELRNVLRTMLENEQILFSNGKYGLAGLSLQLLTDSYFYDSQSCNGQQSFLWQKYTPKLANDVIHAAALAVQRAHTSSDRSDSRSGGFLA